MLWLDIVIVIGLLSVFIPAMFAFVLSLKTSNTMFKSFLITIFPLLFAATPIFYIYSGSQLYIMFGIMMFASVIAGFGSYYFLREYHHHKSMVQTQTKAG